jgi:3'(2'), 5'-bisphosphate nucleotidase
MRQIELQNLIPEICALASKAGDAIMAVYDRAEGASVQLANKADQSPLTQADLDSHHVISEGLARLRSDIAVVSEEDADSMRHRTSMGSFWLIDPLDGTKEFLARNGEFTVNIALVVKGEPVWGVVHAPALEQMYWGGQSWGAWRALAGAGRRVESIRVSAPVSAGNRFRVVASKSHLNAQTSAFIERLGAADLVQAGSSLKFCRVAEGLADVYPRLAPTCEWDTAAAQAVLEGAGGQVVDEQGTRLRYGKANVLNPHFIASSVALNLLVGHHG